MRAARLLGVVALVASWWVLLAPRAGADAPEATGWWSTTRARQPAVDAPWHPSFPGSPPTTQPVQRSTVPPGGLYVAGEHVQTPEESTPDPAAQHTGVSALRLTVGEHAAVGDLVLQVHQLQPGVPDAQGAVGIQACPSTVVWTPEEGGPITSRPPFDCSAGLAFGATDGNRVRIPVGGLVRDGVLNIVLMPQPGSAFQATFEKPTAESISVTRYDPPAAGAGGNEPFQEFFLPPTVDPAPVVPPVSPIDEILVEVAPPSCMCAPEIAPRPRSGPSREVVGGNQPISTSVPELTTWQKAMAGGVLALLVALYLLLLRAPQALPAIGPFSPSPEERPRGIGRFARVRTGPNPRL